MREEKENMREMKTEVELSFALEREKWKNNKRIKKERREKHKGNCKEGKRRRGRAAFHADGGGRVAIFISACEREKMRERE